MKLWVSLPPLALSPNHDKRSVYGKQRATKEYRASCQVEIRQQKPAKRSFNRAVIHATFYLARHPKFGCQDGLYRPRDEDNARASIKALQDALVDEQVLAQDGKQYVRVGRTVLLRRAKEHGGRMGIEIEIEEDSK